MFVQNLKSGLLGKGGHSEFEKLDTDLHKEYENHVEPYRKAVAGGTMDEVTARATYLREATDATNDYINATDIANIKEDAFIETQLKSNVAMQSQSNGLWTVSKIISEYNKNAENSGLSQKQFAEGVQMSNQHLGNYLKNLNGAKARVIGYYVQLGIATIKTAALKAATMLLTGAISTLVSMALGALLSGADYVLHRTEKIIEKGEEAKKTIASLSEEFNKTSKSVNDISQRFAELSQGVDSLTGKNISLSNDDYEEFLGLSNELANLLPSLPRIYDENGNAIIALNGNVNTITESLNTLLATERLIAHQKIEDNLSDVYKGARKQAEKYNKEIKKIQKKIDIEKNYRGANLAEELSNYSETDKAELANLIFSGVDSGELRIGGGDNFAELNNVLSITLKTLSDIGIEVDDIKEEFGDGFGEGFKTAGDVSAYTVKLKSVEDLTEEQLETIKESIQTQFSENVDSYIRNTESSIALNQINGLYDDLQVAINNNKLNWSGVTDSLKKWLNTDSEFLAMDDDIQAFIQKMIDGLDYDALDMKNFDQLSDFIDKNIIGIFNDNPTFKNVYKDMTGLYREFENGSVSVEEYTKKIKDLVNTLNALEIDDNVKKILGLLFGVSLDNGETEYDRMLTSVQNHLKESEKGSATEMSKRELEMAYKIMSEQSENTIMNFSTLMKRIKEAFEENDKMPVTSTNLAATLKEFQTLAKAYKEFSNGSVAFSTIEKMRESFADNSKITEYCNELYDTGTSAERVKEILTELTYAQLEAEYSTKDLANASVTQVASMLKEAGVVNSVEVATYAIATAKERLKIAALDSIEATDEFVKNLDKEAVACGLTKGALIDLVAQEIIFNNSELSVDDKIEKLKEYTTALGIPVTYLDELQRKALNYNDEVSKYNYKKMHQRGSLGVDLGVDLGVGTLLKTGIKPITESDIVEAWNQTLEEVANRYTNADYTPTSTKKGKTEAELLKEATKKWISGREHSIKVLDRWMDEATDKGDYASVQKYSNDIIKIYREMQEEVHKVANKYREMGYDETSEEVSELSEKWWNYSEGIKNAMRESFETIVNNARSSLDGIQSAYDTLKNAAKEYAEYGYITVNTFKNVLSLGVEYLAFLVDENGQLKINEESINKVIKARTQQLAIETSLNYIQSLRTALTENDTDSLNRLLYATDAATKSTWSFVYAQLATIDLNEEQYSTALERINTIRQLSETAVMSVGKVSSSWTDSVNSVLKYVMDMIKQEVNNQIDALEKQVDKYKKIVELQKESLKLAKEKDKYDSTVAEKVKKIAKLQTQIAALSLDDSREAKAKKTEYEEELAELQKDLADYQSDYAYDSTVDSLDRQSDAYEEAKKKEIEALKKTIDSQEELYQKAISRIESQWDTLYSQLILWNSQYGSDLNRELTKAWENASEAVKKYGSFVAALDATRAASSNDEVNKDYPTTTVSSRDNTQTVKYLVRQMRDNSDAWWASSDEGRARLDDQNKRLASQIEELINKKLVRKDGVWYIGSVGGEKLYEKYKYHKGGIVGNDPSIKDNEVLSLLEKDEMVLDKSKKEGLYKLVDLRDKWGDAIDRLTESLFGKGTRIEMTGISDIASKAAKHLAGVNNNEVVQHVDASVVIHGDVDNDSWKKIYPALKEHQKEVARIVNSETVSRFHKVGVF